MRDAGQEVSLRHRGTPQANSASLAEMLLGRLTSPTRAARRAEMQLKLQQMLNAMEPLDREILALRHFEELTNGEVAHVLGRVQDRGEQPLHPRPGAAQGDAQGHAGLLDE